VSLGVVSAFEHFFYFFSLHRPDHEVIFVFVALPVVVGEEDLFDAGRHIDQPMVEALDSSSPLATPLFSLGQPTRLHKAPNPQHSECIVSYTRTKVYSR
jgi:hypothetical protein